MVIKQEEEGFVFGRQLETLSYAIRLSERQSLVDLNLLIDGGKRRLTSRISAEHKAQV